MYVNNNTTDKGNSPRINCKQAKAKITKLIKGKYFGFVSSNVIVVLERNIIFILYIFKIKNHK